MKNSFRIAVFLCFSLVGLLNSQELPPIEIYSPEIYGADNQNWSISQAKDKFIYVANNKGLLEFNGEKWQLYDSPNGKMRSVNVIDDFIYTGSYREFGYWKKNKLGLLIYTSLSENLNIEFLEDEEFWSIIKVDEYILFQSLKRIYIYNQSDNSYSVINSETQIHKIFKVNESIYFQKLKDGIYKIKNGKSELISNHEIIKNNKLVNILDYKDNLLIETEDSGFFILENETLLPWDVPANKLLSNVSVYRSVQLKDKSFVVGTRSNGIFNISFEGEINYSIDYSKGLSNNTIHYIFEDSEHNIWLALENGINCVNVESPFKIYNDKQGKIGTIYASILFDEYLYLGTNQGLFYKSLNAPENEFKFVFGTGGPVRCLVVYDNTLFCGHDIGTFIINKDKVIDNIEALGTWNIVPINKENTLLLQGHYDGLSVLEKVNNTWRFRNKIKGFDISSKFFEILNTNNILVSHEYRGVFKIKVNDDFARATEVVKDSTIEKGQHSSLIKYNNNLYYSFSEGVFKYNTSKNQFQKDTVLSQLFEKEAYTSGKLIPDVTNNILWGVSKKDISYLSPGKLSNIPKVNKVSFSKGLSRGLTGYENISHLKNQEYLIGTSMGYIVLDLDKVHNKSYNISINSITIGSLEHDILHSIDKTVKGEFDNKESTLQFSYSVAEFDKYLDTEYQYQLEGISSQWSSWSSNSSVLFKNLPFGDYTFKVRASIGNKISNNMATYSFSIKRPWFLSNIMMITYVVLVFLFSLFIHNIYKRYYKNQREKLMEKTLRELELKELENKQQLMRFNNEKLRQDIENKNRELGISTMSLIKKNEFLNSIKKELQNSPENKNLKSVIKIIDRNLNNSDDWSLFEEAFNNADKDFLKKIKSEHPSLTSNDLRLCAYLRLNLSSKEIAPLLNISPRSVEVKRYRLRKKMDLKHESSLSDYILEM